METKSGNCLNCNNRVVVRKNEAGSPNQAPTVSIKEALIFVFCLPPNLKLDDNRLIACKNCARMIKCLYQLRCGLDKLSKANSYLKEILQGAGQNTHYGNQIISIKILPAEQQPRPVHLEPVICEKNIRKCSPSRKRKRVANKMKEHSYVKDHPVEVKTEPPDCDIQNPNLVAGVEVLKAISSEEPGASAQTDEVQKPIEVSREKPPTLKFRIKLPKKRVPKIYEYKCPECNKEFKTKQRKALDFHIARVHRGTGPHSCDVCGKPNFSVFELEHHKLSHLPKAERPSKQKTLCNVCGATVLNIKQHMKLHDEIRKNKAPRVYKCNDCPRTCSSKGTLKRHRALHENEGYFPFKCDACEDGFKTAQLLREHYLFCPIKAKERPHQCAECGKRFKLKQHWALHLVDIHHKSNGEAREIVYPGLPIREVKCKRKKTKIYKEEDVSP